MADLASQLQLRVLDRPVIDQSGLTDRFDFTLNWTPDEFQFPRASAAQRAAVPTNPDAPPDLFSIPRTTRHETGGEKGSYRYRGDRQGVEAVGELSSDTVGWRALGDKVQS